jgi:hypothetical protein
MQVVEEVEHNQDQVHQEELVAEEKVDQLHQQLELLIQVVAVEVEVVVLQELLEVQV